MRHFFPDGHPKLLHLWPPKLFQAGRQGVARIGSIQGQDNRTARVSDDQD